MIEKLKEEREKLIEEIEEERRKIFDLEEANIKKSFGKFFLKPLFLALIFAVIFNYMGFGDKKVIGGFILSFFIFLFINSYKTKRDFEERRKKIQEEKIKIQASIFAKANKLGQIEEDLKEN